MTEYNCSSCPCLNNDAELLDALKLALDALEHCARLPIVEQAEEEARALIAKLSQE